MKNIILFFVTLLVVTQVNAAKDSIFQAIPKFEKGQKFRFQVTHSRNEYLNDRQVMSKESIYESKMTILVVSPAFLKIQYEYLFDVENELGVPKQLVKKFKKDARLVLIYKVSTNGQFEELENWDQVGKTLQKLVTKTMQMVSNESPNQAKPIRAGLQPKLESFKRRDVVEATVLKDVRLLHYPASLELCFDKPTSYKGALPNYFGGETIKAKIDVKSRNLGQAEGFEINAVTLPNDPDLKQKAYNYLFNKKLVDGNGEKNPSVIVRVRLDRNFKLKSAQQLPAQVVEETHVSATHQDASVVKQMQTTIMFIK